MKMSSINEGNVGTFGVCNSHGLKFVERRLKIAEVVLRWVICGLGLLVAVLVGTDSQVKEILTIEKRARFTDMKASVFLVIANGMVASYCLVQAVRCSVSMCRGSRNLLLNKPVAWVIFSGDQVMAYVTLAAAAASTQSGVLSKKGQPQFGWIKLCNLYEKFCTQVGEGLVTSYLVCVGMIALSSISAFHLFRLYGDKGKNRC